MAGCCGLDLYRESDGRLLCWECRVPVRIGKKEGKESKRCVVRYVCPVCGKEKISDCGERTRVQTAHGDMLIEAEG